MVFKDKKPPSLKFGIAAGGLAVLLILVVTILAAPKKASEEQALNSSQETGTTPLASGEQNVPPRPTMVLSDPLSTAVAQSKLEVATVAAAQQEQLKKLQDQLNTLTAKPFTLTYGDQNWKIQPAQFKKLVKIDNFALDIDRKALGDIVAGWAKNIDRRPTEPLVDWSEKEGKLVAQKPGKPGQKVNVDTTLDAIKAAITKGENQAAMTVEPALPKIDVNNLQALGIKEVISEGVSGFAGSDANRAKNIMVGADYLDNTLVPPHGTFSFNDAIGLISKERGYADGYAIVGDITEKDVGGGICQVSTTAFRAAFWAGFNITERHEHAYRVTWYESLGEPVGFDATIYQPGLDFKFTNDTDNWILVASYVNNAKLRVVIYGTKPGWKVDMAEGSGDAVNVTNPPPDRFEVDPKLPPGAKNKVDSAHKGFDTFVGRIVKGQDGQVIRKDTFRSHYVAWPNIYKVGPSPSPVPATATAAASPSAPAKATTAAPDKTNAPAATTAPAPAKTTAPATTAAPKPPAATTAPAAPPPTTAAPAQGNNQEAPPQPTTPAAPKP